MFGWKKEEKNDARPDGRHCVATTELESNNASREGVYAFSIMVFLVSFGVVFALTWPWFSPLTVCVSLVAALFCVSSIRIVPQWERAVVLRFGKFNRVKEPGLFFCIPFAESVAIHIDHRVMTSSFSAEAALTADLVPIDVDAVLFWMVWDAKKACLEVENYPKAVLWSAQTAMRDAIGQLNLADISMRRKQIDRELEEALAQKCENWGVTVLSVEIRDIMIPHELQDALSKEAQAEREKNARVILAEIEKDISEMYVEAAETYEKSEKAMQLRAMNLAYEGAKDGKGLLLLPSALAEGFDVGKLFKK